MYCKNCGAKITAQQTICLKCKATLKSTTSKNNKKQVNNGQHILGKILTAIGVVWLMLLIFGLIGLISTGEFIDYLIYEPGYFFEEVFWKGLMSAAIGIVFIKAGKHFSKK